MNTFGIDIWSHLDRKATKKIRDTLCRNRVQNGNSNGEDDDDDDHYCDSNSSDRRSKDVENNADDTGDSNFSSVLPTLLVTDRRKNGTGIQRHYLDPPINQLSLGKFVEDFVHGRTEPEKKSSRVGEEKDDGKDNKSSSNNNEQKCPTSNHGIHLLTADSLSQFLKANQEKHVLVQLYAPTCGHCKRFNIIWNSLGELIEFLGWSDQLLLARIDVTSNEIFVPGMVATWLPDLFYFGVGVYENPIHYGNTPVADEVELGGISDPLDILEWWMDQAGDVINEAELLHVLEGQSTNNIQT